MDKTPGGPGHPARAPQVLLPRPQVLREATWVTAASTACSSLQHGAQDPAPMLRCRGYGRETVHKRLFSLP